MDGVKPEYKYRYMDILVGCSGTWYVLILNNKDECIFVNYN